MVNIPHRSSETLINEGISNRLSAMRRTAGSFALAVLGAIVLAVLLSHTAVDTSALEQLIPLDDPGITGLFTA